MRLRTATLSAGWALTQVAAPVIAAPIEFDCDVPANHYSSVSNLSDQPLSVSGVIDPIEFRSGKFQPVVGALLGDRDGQNTTTFQLVAPSKRPKQFDIVVNIKHGDDLRKGQLGSIRADKPMAFSMSLSKDGTVQLTIADQAFNYEFQPLTAGKEMLFCSTGQFKFSNVTFSGDRATDTQETSSP